MKILHFLFCWLLLTVPAWATSTTFDGAGTFVKVADHANLEATTMTAGCWTYRTGNGEASLGRILGKRDNAPVTGWSMLTNTTEYLFAVDGTTDGDWRITRPSGDAWHHIAVTYDAGLLTNDPIFYVDGVLTSLSTDTNPIGAITISGTSLFIVGNNNEETVTWAGRVANCFYYNRILTAEEIKSVMRCNPKAVPNGLQAYLPLGVFAGRNLSSAGPAQGSIFLGSGSHNGDGPPVHCPQGGTWE